MFSDRLTVWIRTRDALDEILTDLRSDPDMAIARNDIQKGYDAIQYLINSAPARGERHER